MTLLYRIVVLSLIWCALFIRSSDGQWNKVGTLGPQLNDTLGGSYGEGAIHFKDGIIWAGQEVITYSTDTGRSWTPLGRPVPFDYFHDFTILAISFANTDTGVISYGNGGPEDPNDVSTEDGVFRTTDRGKSWQRIFSSFNDRSFDVSYDHSPSVIHVSDNNSAIMGTSLDGGTTWNRVTLSGGYFTDFVAARDQKLYAVASLTKNTPTADVYTSADRGMTWSKAGGGLSFDSYG
ncbi:MAG TPA: hypothetical protein VFX22_08160, partial [Candidatus Kapabacteria bacterium]|nr:hypothetical protein [Candidatus Kapabacteria bacterium]